MLEIGDLVYRKAQLDLVESDSDYANKQGFPKEYKIVDKTPYEETYYYLLETCDSGDVSSFRWWEDELILIDISPVHIKVEVKL